MAVIRRKTKDGSARYMVRIETVREDGARAQRIVGTFGTLREANTAHAKAIASRESGSLLDPNTTTVAVLLDEWLHAKTGSITPNSQHDYEVVIRRHIKPALGGINIQKLTAAKLQSQYSAWRDAGLSPRVIRGCHMRLSQALDYAVRMRLLLHNPAKDARPPRLSREKFETWCPAEATTFLRNAHDDPLAPLWDLLLREGMRRGEALGLRWRDVSLDEGTAHVKQTVVPDKSNRGAALIQNRVKTAGGARSIRLTRDTVAAVRDHRVRWLERRLAAPEWADTDLIVCTGAGQPINPNNVARAFNRIVAEAGLRRIRVQDLRHTSATLLLLAGEHPKVVSERLGHAGVAITLDLYSHVVPSMQVSAADRMNALLATAGEATT